MECLIMGRLVSVFIIFSIGSLLFSQRIGEIEHPVSKLMKVENQLVMSWRSVSKKPDENQIELFDQHGQRLAVLSVLRLVPDAQSVTIYDVSARAPRIIAVSAVYRSIEGGTAATL